MSAAILQDAFGHHVWASLQLLEVVFELTPEQLETAVPGTYGSILDTLRHLVEADANYLSVASGEGGPIDADSMGVGELREEMAAHGDRWSALVARDLDPAEMRTRNRPDGSAIEAPMGIRLAQALHHGTDHRSQVCTALTSLGIEPPAIDVWDFGLTDNRVIETPPSS